MTKVSFPFSVIHGGRWHVPHEAFEADESEVDELIALGAKVVGMPADALEKASEHIATKSTARQAKSSSQKKG